VSQDKRARSEAAQKKKYQAFADDAINGDEDAMDIDTSTPPIPNGNANKAGIRTAPSSPRREYTRNPLPNGSATEPSSATETHPPDSAWSGLGAMAKDDLFTSARNSQEGGIALDDLASTLPYESEASNTHPTKPSTAQKLKVPTLPRAPQLPPRLERIFVDLYFSQFEAYVREYRKASKEMTAHFVARDAEVDEMDNRFVHHRGETSKKMGFPSYLAKMREDEVVMETWKLFQETHLTALAQCEEVRNKTMKMYSPTSAG
jgi:hypothetical protein